MSTWPPPGDVPAPRSAGSPDRRIPYDGRRYYDSYSSDPYALDRDGYGRDRHYPPDFDRERDWAEWDRRRAATRGRSRSPLGVDDGTYTLASLRSTPLLTFDIGRRKRRRSFSPHERDRYDPRARYEEGEYSVKSVHGHTDIEFPVEDFRGGGRPRSPSGYSHRGPSRYPDPYDSDVPVNYRTFADWFQANHPEDFAADEAAAADAPKEESGHVGIRARYEKYRKAMIAKQVGDPHCFTFGSS